jgi:hypothetical protein
MFEIILARRNRSKWWNWAVQGPSGKIIMSGSEKARSEAKYQGERALFLLLMTAHRVYTPSRTS